MKVRILESQLRVATVRARMPFRYGIATMTEAPHVFVEVQAEIGGTLARGLAADHLPPKWFTKNPATSLAADVAAMREVIAAASAAALRVDAGESVFAWWRALYAAQKGWGWSAGCRRCCGLSGCR